MRRPHLPANTNIKAFTNLRHRRARPTSNWLGRTPLHKLRDYALSGFPSRDCVCTNDARKRDAIMAI